MQKETIIVPPNGYKVDKENSTFERIVFKEIRDFSKSYWYVTLLCMTFYSAIFPFTALSTNFFAEKWGLPSASGEGLGFFQAVFSNFMHLFSTAPGTSSIIIFASMVFAPFAGGLVDRIGKRATMMLFGSLLMIPSYLLLAFTTLPPKFAMCLLGASFVLVPAAMWPSIPLVVKPQLIGTAFGLTNMIQNIGLMTFPWLNGHLRVLTQNYTASMIMFASLGLLGFVLSIALRSADAKSGGILENPGSQGEKD